DPVSAGRVLYVSPTPRPWRRSTRDSTGWNRSCGAWPAAAERAAGYSRPVERGGPAVDWRGRRVAVVGLGRENVPLARYLMARGARVTGFDRQDPGDLPAPARALAALGVRLIGGPGYREELAAGDFEAAVLTPGMAQDGPEIQALRDRGTLITSQTNLFLQRCRAPVVGITGSSGKSTTTTLVGRILEADGRRPVYVGGNIGRVLIEQVDEIEPDARVVLELSSFQLELVDRSPHIGVLLNLRPNHLDVHASMAAYEAAKRRIFAYQRPEAGDVAVLEIGRAHV